MAGTFSPKNVGKLLIAKANRAGDTITDYKTNAVSANLEAAVIGSDGSAVSANAPFKVFVKQNDSLTGINVSDKIEPKSVDSVKVFPFIAETAREIDVTGFTGAVESNATYRVSIRKYDHIQSSENFRHIHGFAVTKNNTTLTQTDVMNEIKANLDTALQLENSLGEFDVVVGADKITITNKPQAYVQGKIQGLPVRFDVEVSVKSSFPQDLNDGQDLGLLDVVVVNAGAEGQGTGKQIANLEYFLNGYENADYGREVGFPNNFNFTPLTNVNGIYNSVVILFHKDREYANVERQPKELTVVFEKAADDLASNASVNAFLAQLRTSLGVDNVPADLAVI